MNRLAAGTIAVVAGLFAAIRYGVHSTPSPLAISEATTDWVMVASIVTSIISAIEAVCSGVSKLIALLTRSKDAPQDSKA